MKRKSHKAGKMLKTTKKNNILKSFAMSINIEKILFTGFFIFFSLLLLTQVMFTLLGLKEGLIINSRIEGFPLEKEEYLYKEGEITLELRSEYRKEGHKVKILVNGEEAGDFSFGQLSLNVKHGDIIEIDSTNVNSKVQVTIKKTSPNIINDDFSKEFVLNAEVKRIIKVKIQ
ncbi:MAG TPA: hypothetical protein GXX37_03250 [Clostridiaceae bacterium]|nr:hypothetical protein [Clostridiaceae bacterium]